MACVESFIAAPRGVPSHYTFYKQLPDKKKSSMLPSVFNENMTAKAWYGILRAYLYPLQDVQFIFTLAIFMLCMQQNGHLTLQGKPCLTYVAEV